MMKLIVVAALLGVAAGQFQRNNPNSGRPTFGGAAPAPATRVTVRTGDAEARRAIEREATIVRFEQTQDENQPGTFDWAFETSDGSSASAKGFLKPPAPNSEDKEPIQEIQGQYSYTSDDGVPIQATYVANELGFQVQSDAIPKPHPIPEEIRRSLDEIFAGIEAEGKLSKQEVDEIRARYNY